MSYYQATEWTKCPVCGREMAATSKGRFYQHLVAAMAVCPGAGKTPVETRKLLEQESS